MSAIGAKPAAGAAVDTTAMVVGIIILLLVIGATYYLFGSGLAFMALIGIIIGGVLIGFGVHFVPVGGGSAAMGQKPVLPQVWLCSRLVQVLPVSLEGPGLLKWEWLSQP